MNIDKALLAKRKAVLEQVGKQLKTEFYGLDTIIDKAIASVYAWYVFPELIRRPVIVNLWGMTGVGKTQLVRRLAALLGFSNKFVEIQMDGTSGGSMYRQDSICSILSNCIDEGEPGILLLDEIQRFRTVADDGTDMKVERYQDVWMLLSDGKFAANSDLFIQLEMMIASQQYQDEQEKERNEERETQVKTPKAEGASSSKATADDDKPTVKARHKRFKVHPWEAKMFKQMLRLPESVVEIMTWDAKKIGDLLNKIVNERIDWQIDYTKLIIFVSGNLDSAFAGSGSTEDCDTDADFYHKITSMITVTDIKRSLRKRFKPEQISRLGSNHVIYPSMAKSSYQKLIRATCEKYIVEMREATDIRFSVEPEVYDVIYTNAVYPTQGTRPVFSAIHQIFSTGLVNIACWCLEHNIHDVSLRIDIVAQKMIATDAFSGKEYSTVIDLEITRRKAKISTDMKTLIAAHESGHAVVYALLTKSAPLETKINATSFANGYMIPNDSTNQNLILTKKMLRNDIAVELAGTVAEEIVFGPDNRSSGCRTDIANATASAALYVRKLGFDGTLSHINGDHVVDIVHNTDLQTTNAIVENILKEEYERAKTLLTENFQFYRTIVDKLLDVGTLDQKQFIEAASEFVELGTQAQLQQASNQTLNQQQAQQLVQQLQTSQRTQQSNL